MLLQFVAHTERTMPRPSKGFTLIELMIAVAIVAILAAVAYPSYKEHVLRSNRAAAQAVLLDGAAKQKQLLLDTRSYAADWAALGVLVPADVERNYEFDVDEDGSVSAAPEGSQSDDSCGTLGVSSTGAKTPTTDRCW
jgi:type IV pilus assembly protein PilE